MEQTLKHEMLTPELRDKILTDAEKPLPAATAKLFAEYVSNSEQTKKDLDDALEQIRRGNIDKGKLNDNITNLQRWLEIEKGKTAAHKSLDAREKEIGERERDMKHTLEIEKLKTSNAISQTGLAVSLFESVFKPVTLRKEVQRQVATRCNSGQSPSGYSDNNGNQIMQDGGEHTDTDDLKDSSTEIEE